MNPLKAKVRIVLAGILLACTIMLGSSAPALAKTTGFGAVHLGFGTFITVPDDLPGGFPVGPTGLSGDRRHIQFYWPVVNAPPVYCIRGFWWNRGVPTPLIFDRGTDAFMYGLRLVYFRSRGFYPSWADATVELYNCSNQQVFYRYKVGLGNTPNGPF